MKTKNSLTVTLEIAVPEEGTLKEASAMVAALKEVLAKVPAGWKGRVVKVQLTE